MDVLFVSDQRLAIKPLDPIWNEVSGRWPIKLTLCWNRSVRGRMFSCEQRLVLAAC